MNIHICIVARSKIHIVNTFSEIRISFCVRSVSVPNFLFPGKKPSTTTSLGSPTVNKDLRSLGLGGVIIKNPGPPIRVGLSRNMKVKPLHSKVSVSR